MKLIERLSALVLIATLAACTRLEPRFKVVNLQGVGHFPMLEDPQTFNRVLERIVAAWVSLEPQRNSLSEVPGTR